VIQRRLQRVTDGPVRALAPLALLGALVLAACTGEAAPSVEVGPVSRSTVTEVVEAPANVAARATATVTAPATGTVAALAVRDGQRVTRGQVLLRIDSPAARRSLAQAEQADSQAASAAGGGALPSIDVRALTRSSSAADSAFDGARQAAAAVPDASLRTQALAKVAAAEAEYDATRASVQRTVSQVNAGLRSLGRLSSSLAQAQRTQTRAAVSAARSAVDALTVRAPIGGTVVFGGGGAPGAAAGTGDTDVSSVVSQLPASVQGQAQSVLGGAGAAAGPGVTAPLEVGATVTSGSPLLTITDVSALSLTASVDETDVLLVTPGVAADVELDAVPGAAYTATVRSVDLQPTTSSRGGVSYLVRLSLSTGTGEDGEAAPAPRPGMSAVARLKVRTAVDAISVPAAAVFRDGSRDAVWVVEDGRAHRRDVRLGAQGDAAVQVASGLRSGESVVVRGADRVTEGQQVTSS
jgi:multidrug efflux pump subunit AcrA (membrane-fusion protein)